MNMFDHNSSVSLRHHLPQSSHQRALRLLLALGSIFVCCAPLVAQASDSRSTLIENMLQNHRIQCFIESTTTYRAASTDVLPASWQHCTYDSNVADMRLARDHDAEFGTWTEPLLLFPPLNMNTQLELTALSCDEGSSTMLAVAWLDPDAK